MFAPAPQAQPPLASAPLVPVEIGATTPSSGGGSSLSPSTTVGVLGRVSLRIGDAHMNTLVGHRGSISGTLLTVSPSGTLRGRMVTLQALGARGWRTIARASTDTEGRFRVRYLPRRSTSELVRLRFAGDASDRGVSRLVGRLNVYRLALASWYGGGGSLACGGQLTSTTMGVANKTLPCGSEVTLRYGGRTVRVRVIDRGPYVPGREFDLTEATKRALGFGDTGEVWSTD
jgi:rare lipoprotein A